MSAKLPAITGKQLIKLLGKDGRVEHRHGNHGIVMTKRFPSGTRVTIMQHTTKSLPIGTLQDILSVRQTGLGKAGLRRLVSKYGLK